MTRIRGKECIDLRGAEENWWKSPQIPLQGLLDINKQGFYCRSYASKLRLIIINRIKANQSDTHTFPILLYLETLGSGVEINFPSIPV